MFFRKFDWKLVVAKNNEFAIGLVKKLFQNKHQGSESHNSQIRNSY